MNSENYSEIVSGQGDEMMRKIWVGGNPHNGQIDIDCTN